MGNRFARRPPPGGPNMSPRRGNSPVPRPFPILSPQSYLPGAAAAGGGQYPGMGPPQGPGQFPAISPNSYLPQQYPMEPGYPYPQAPFQHEMSYPNMDPMSAPFHHPGYNSYPHHPPIRGRPRARRCRPVVHIIESSSCSSISTCTTRSSCSRSRSHSRRYRTCHQQQQQQQPIILLPIQCDQSQGAMTGSFFGQQPNQGQQIVIPPIQIQQAGQPPRQLALPPIQLNSSSFMQNSNATPMFINNGQSMIQPAMSMSPLGRPQQIQAGPIQYVQATPHASQLHGISARSHASRAPQRILVNSTKRKHSTIGRPSQRSVSIRSLTRKNLKHARRSMEYPTRERKRNIPSRQRRETRAE